MMQQGMQHSQGGSIKFHRAKNIRLQQCSE